jgi:hypothetical protein
MNKFPTINKWTSLSIEYANQRSYLDDLFAVYPTLNYFIVSIEFLVIDNNIGIAKDVSFHIKFNRIRNNKKYTEVSC